MCIACERDAMWFAYLQRKGLITPEGYLVEDPPSLYVAAEPSADQDNKPADSADGPADKNKFSRDDPT
jgi:hypothetical protein